MRELIEKNRKITVVPSDFKCANKIYIYLLFSINFSID